MSVTWGALTGRAENFHQIERLCSSNLLHGSESLCKLLRFLAERSLDHPATAVKEYQIATEVFGRPADFDPRLDSTVRVQTGRLRSKLAEYYAGAGVDDPIIVEIPKGSYALTFHARPTPSTAPVAVLPPDPASPRVVTEKRAETIAPKIGLRGLQIAILALSVALASAITALAYLIFTRPSVAVVSSAPPSEDVETFRHLWRHFIDTPDQPWVVFSNAEFVGRPETGMRYFKASSDANDPILDHYTGVGEVLGVHELDRVFTVLNHELRVKRGRLLSLDDAKNNDLIFVGSPSENLSLREIPSTQDFVFRQMDTPARKGDLAIVNVRPRGDEPKIFFASPSIPLAEDYALVALAPGMNASHWVMLLAGTTTLGTQAAVEYVCRTKTIEELLRRLNGTPARDAVLFEAVLRVKVSHGVPVQSKLVAVHTRSTS